MSTRFPNGIDADLVSDSVDAVAVAADSLVVGATGSSVTLVKKATVSVDLASIAAGEINEETVTVTGAVAGDSVVVNPPAALAAGIGVVGAFVSAADTVKLRVFNSTGAPIDEAAANWVFLLVR